MFLRGIRWIMVVAIIIVLLPVIAVKSIFVFCAILFSSSIYERPAFKSNAIYEAIRMPIHMVREIYHIGMNKKIVEQTAGKTKFEEIIVKGITYAVGLLLFIGPLLNMYTSGYYALNQDSIMKKNIQLKNEMEEIKKDITVYGIVYSSKPIILSDYDAKIAKREAFVFEHQMELGKVEKLCFEIMKKHNFEMETGVDNEVAFPKMLFRKNEYIVESYFLNNNEMEITARRYDWFRESKWYDVLSPIMMLTSPWNPFKWFGF